MMHAHCGLVLRLPSFLPSVCVHSNTQNQKIGKKLKQERPGSIHHVSGHKVDVGGEGLINVASTLHNHMLAFFSHEVCVQVGPL